MAAPTMAQRTSCTPRLVLLAVVSAYYSAVAASENYVEISPSDGCADTTVRSGVDIHSYNTYRIAYGVSTCTLAFLLM